RLRAGSMPLRRRHAGRARADAAARACALAQTRERDRALDSIRPRSGTAQHVQTLSFTRAASAAVNPTVEAISCVVASRIPRTDPNFFSSAFFFFGPTPG